MSKALKIGVVISVVVVAACWLVVGFDAKKHFDSEDEVGYQDYIDSVNGGNTDG